MKKVIITGAAGFLGYSTTKEFLKQEYEVYAIIRPQSDHNIRLSGLSGKLHRIELDCNNYDRLSQEVSEKCDLFIHLVSFGDRSDFSSQKTNMEYCLNALKSASSIGCKRFICIGTQAEIGITDKTMDESIALNPESAYGACKAAALYLTRDYAKRLGIDWIWARIFSLYGTYAPSDRLLPVLIRSFKANKDITLSSCEQNWDFLNVEDAARALVCLAESGYSGEVYNIASGEDKPLKYFIERAIELLKYTGSIRYGDRIDPFVSLQPDISKIKAHTGWIPMVSFDEGVLKLADEED